MIDTVRAEDVRSGDIVTSVYNPDAVRRQPAGWRQGDPVVRGRFVDVLPNGAEFTVLERRESDVHGIVLVGRTTNLSLAVGTKVEVIR